MGIESGIAFIAGALGVGTAAATVIFNIAVSTVLAAASSLIAKRGLKGSPDISARTITGKSSYAPQQIIYGEAVVAAPTLAYHNTAGPSNMNMYAVHPLAGHECEAITDVWLDNNLILESEINGGAAAGGAVSSGTYAPRRGQTVAEVWKHLGTSTQAANATLVATFADWTSAHQLRGIAYGVTMFSLWKRTQALWEAGDPRNVKFKVKGKIIYDPRLDTSPGANPDNASYFAWSDNPALCLADYLRDSKFSPLAGGVAASRIDWDSVVTAADICDTLVSIPGATTEKRFTCNGVLYGTADPDENVAALLSSMNGELIFSGEKYVMYAFGYEAPAGADVLDEDDIIGPIGVTPALDSDKRINTLKATFVDPTKNYEPTDTAPISFTSLLDDRDGGDELIETLELPLTNSWYMAQRICQMVLRESNEEITLNIPCNLRAARLVAGERVSITLTERGWTPKIFKVLGWTFFDRGQNKLGVNLQVKEDDSAAYADPTVGEYNTVTGTGVLTPGDPVLIPSIDTIPRSIRYGEGAWNIQLVNNSDNGTADSNDGEVYFTAGEFVVSDGTTNRALASAVSVYTPYEGATVPPDGIFYLVWGTTNPVTRFSGSAGDYGDLNAEAAGLFPAIYDNLLDNWYAIDNLDQETLFTPADDDFVVARGIKTSASGGIDSLQSLVAFVTNPTADRAPGFMGVGGKLTYDNLETTAPNAAGEYEFLNVSTPLTTWADIRSNTTKIRLHESDGSSTDQSAYFDEMVVDEVMSYYISTNQWVDFRITGITDAGAYREFDVLIGEYKEAVSTDPSTADGSTVQFFFSRAPQGDTGATGATGPQGAKGDTGDAGATGRDGTGPLYTNQAHVVKINSGGGGEIWTGSGGVAKFVEGNSLYTLDTDTQGTSFPVGNSRFRLNITAVSGDTLTEPAITGSGTTSATIADWAGTLTTVTVYKLTYYYRDSQGNTGTAEVDISISPSETGTKGDTGDTGAGGRDGHYINFTNQAHSVPVTNLGVETWTGSGGLLTMGEGVTAYTLDVNTQGVSFPVSNSEFRLDITAVSGDTLTEPAITGAGTTTATIADWAGNLTTVTVYRITAYYRDSNGDTGTLTVDVTLTPGDQGEKGDTGDTGAGGRDGTGPRYTNQAHVVKINSLGGGEIWTGSGGLASFVEGNSLYTLDTNAQGTSFPATNSRFRLDITAVSGDTLTEPAITGSGTTTATIADWAGTLTTVTTYRLTYYYRDSNGATGTAEVDISISPSETGLKGDTGDTGSGGRDGIPGSGYTVDYDDLETTSAVNVAGDYKFSTSSNPANTGTADWSTLTTAFSGYLHIFKNDANVNDQGGWFTTLTTTDQFYWYESSGRWIMFSVTGAVTESSDIYTIPIDYVNHVEVDGSGNISTATNAIQFRFNRIRAEAPGLPGNFSALSYDHARTGTETVNGNGEYKFSNSSTVAAGGTSTWSDIVGSYVTHLHINTTDGGGTYRFEQLRVSDETIVTWWISDGKWAAFRVTGPYILTATSPPAIEVVTLPVELIAYAETDNQDNISAADAVSVQLRIGSPGVVRPGIPGMVTRLQYDHARTGSETVTAAGEYKFSTSSTSTSGGTVDWTDIVDGTVDYLHISNLDGSSDDYEFFLQSIGVNAYVMWWLDDGKWVVFRVTSLLLSYSGGVSIPITPVFYDESTGAGDISSSNSVNVDLRFSQVLNYVTLDGSNNLELRNPVVNGHVQLQGYRSGPTLLTLLEIDPQAGTDLYGLDGTTWTKSVTVEDPDSTQPLLNVLGSNPGITFASDDTYGTMYMKLFRASGGQRVNMRILQPGEDLYILTRDFADGANHTQIQVIAESALNANDAYCQLNYDGSNRLQTTSPGITVNGSQINLTSTPGTYTPTNVTTDRSFDANSTSVAELADVVGTLIADMQTIGLLD